MTWNEFGDLVEFMLPRWAGMAGWSDPEWAALFDDLRVFEYADVRRGVESLWNRGETKREIRGGEIRRHLSDLGIPIPAPEVVPCDHRWSHETPSRASFAVRRGAGERTCRLCGIEEECDCVDCRADPKWIEREET